MFTTFSLVKGFFTLLSIEPLAHLHRTYLEIVSTSKCQPNCNQICHSYRCAILRMIFASNTFPLISRAKPKKVLSHKKRSICCAMLKCWKRMYFILFAGTVITRDFKQRKWKFFQEKPQQRNALVVFLSSLACVRACVRACHLSLSPGCVFHLQQTTSHIHE